MSVGTHFPPTKSAFFCFNLFAIWKILLSLFLLMLANYSAWASFIGRYAAVLAALLTFRYPSFEPPPFHCFQVLRLTFTALSSFIPPPSFFVLLTATLSPSTYLICSFKKSMFDRLPTFLHSGRNSLTFHGHSLLKFFSHTSIFQLPSFPSRRYSVKSYNR